GELTDIILFSFTNTATSQIYTLSLHDALPILCRDHRADGLRGDEGHVAGHDEDRVALRLRDAFLDRAEHSARRIGILDRTDAGIDRKSTRLNSSHVSISYAVFCLKKKKMIAVT